ncbi:hypothetical protein GCM10010232_62640 [Streptomyces amakusaensis]|uniref:Integral membrane protein n=1 Tax=Streptomyces amakusaensis TaxID=67271 RepID=A0ABW0AQJ4_9ACTN
MLASVGTGWLWLMAGAATVVHVSAMALWIPDRKFRMAYPFITVLCGACMIMAGRAEGFSLATMLVAYAFALIGLTIGMLPSRKLATMWAREINAGVTRETYDLPRRHIVFCIGVVVVMLFAGSVLTW